MAQGGSVAEWFRHRTRGRDVTGSNPSSDITPYPPAPGLVRGLRVVGAAEHVFVSRVHCVPGSMCLQLLCNLFFFCNFLQVCCKTSCKQLQTELQKVDFFFVCVQKIEEKKTVAKKLQKKGCITVATKLQKVA